MDFLPPPGTPGILALGHALADCIGRAPPALFESLRGMPSPAHIPPERMRALRALWPGPEGGERGAGAEAADSIAWSAGGGAVVTAKAASALGLKTELWASLGKDEEGDFLARDVAAAGVEAHFFFSNQPTGIFCRFSETGGEERIVVSAGAARDVRGTKLPGAAFRSGWIFYVDGLLIDSPVWLGDLAQRARERGMRVALDLSTPGNAARRAGELVSFAREFCDFVFANEAEYEALGPLARSLPLKGSGGAGAKGAPAGLAQDTSKGAPVWIVKRAARGAVLLSGGEALKAAAASVTPIDDTGAGDVFAAGFLRGVLQGEGGTVCLRLGNAAAAATLRYRGSSFDPGALARAYHAELTAIRKSN